MLNMQKWYQNSEALELQFDMASFENLTKSSTLQKLWIWYLFGYG